MISIPAVTPTECKEGIFESSLIGLVIGIALTLAHYAHSHLRMIGGQGQLTLQRRVMRRPTFARWKSRIRGPNLQLSFILCRRSRAN